MQFDLVFQAFGFDPFAGQFQLFLAQGDAEHFRTELPRGIPGQPTPAATDIQQIVTRLQTQLAAQVAEFGLLRLLEGFAAGFEIRAGVGHVAVQPELVERIRQVVMVGNGFGVGFLVVQGTHWLTVVIFAEQSVAQFVADPDDLADRALQFQLAFNECRSERIKAWMGELADHRRVLDHDGDAGRRPQIELMAIPESQAQRKLQIL
ncbi:hypothetical protein D3C81_1366760 [compost metagenome]